MRIHEITQTHARKDAKRVGRGIAAGQGKTAGRGTKGQKSRTGANSNIPRTFEGGSTSLIQRLPKLKGFTSHRVKPVTVTVARIIEFAQSGDVITSQYLIEHGIVHPSEVARGIKLVGASTVTLPEGVTIATDDALLSVSASLRS